MTQISNIALRKLTFGELDLPIMILQLLEQQL